MKTKDKSWRLKLWRLPLLDNLELFHGINMTHDYPLHVHEEYSVLLVLRGAESQTCRGTTHTATPGKLMLSNPDEAHSSSSVNCEYRIMRISLNTLRRITGEVLGRKLETPCFPSPVVEDSLSFRLLLQLHRKLERNASCLEQESEFVSTLGLLIARQKKHQSRLQPIGKEAHYIRMVRDYLKSHYAENISLSRLTSLTNLSPFYLLRVFHTQVGFPPHEYQTQVRIARARKLIRNGNSISQAALETGFFDQSHLSRNFRRIVGMTPGQYFSQSKLHSNIVQDPIN
ncbi:MAG: AraC family transcriptional regulator [Acidobacteriota bacterium]|nr:AraC family transcriptional regulator [Acidobacteriota bacterium]